MIELVFPKEVILLRQVNQKSDVCRCWYFLNEGFNFQPFVCNGSHDALMMSMNLSDTAILNINCADYCCIINRISKNETINLLKNVDLIEKVIHKTFFIVPKRWVNKL